MSAATCSTHTTSIDAAWTVDGHLDVSRYLFIFDRATDAFRDVVDVGKAYALAHHRSLVVAEAHLVYRAPLAAGDVVQVDTRLLGAQSRRLHLFHEMRRASDASVVATAELVVVHVDRASGRGSEFPAHVLERLETLAAACRADGIPRQAGRSIRLEPTS